jgi:hypothetical protein
MAYEESRSISQQVFYLIRHYLATAKKACQITTPSPALLEVFGSWEDARQPGKICNCDKNCQEKPQKAVFTSM